MTTQSAPASMYRTTEGLGIWEHRGKVAAVGVGHSPTTRRWDGKPETSVGANSILALRRAIEDAGVSGFPSQRRAVGECPTPTAATFPLCSHIPNPSVVRYIESGAIWVVIFHSFLAGS